MKHNYRVTVTVSGELRGLKALPQITKLKKIVKAALREAGVINPVLHRAEARQKP